MGKSIGIPLPPPYKGQNDQLPVFALSNPYAEIIENLTTENGVLNLRQGNSLFVTSSSSQIVQNLFSYDSNTLLMFVTDIGGAPGLKWYNITSGVAILVNTLAYGGDDEIHTLYFNKYLFYFGESTLTPTGTGIPYWNGTAWGIAGYTGWSDTPLGGNVYKNRAYFIYRGTAKYAYSKINAISGEVTNEDLSGIVSTNAFLYGIRSTSMSQNVTQENVQCFIFNTGEILVYGGSYPNSGNWGIIGRFKISDMIYINSIVDAKGDSFLLTKTEILSLRNLFIGGYDKERVEGIGAVVKPRWSQIISVLLASDPSLAYFIKGTYQTSKDRLVISLPKYVDRESETIVERPFWLVYDFILGGWTEEFQDSRTDSTFTTQAFTAHSDVIYCGILDETNVTSAVISLKTKLNYIDDDAFDTGSESAISFRCLSAPYPLSKYGVVTTLGIEVFLRSDIYSSLSWRLVGDLGAVSSSFQTIAAPNGSNITKAFMNLGIESNLVQLDFVGISSSSITGTQVLGSNLWINPSGDLSR
jgi:hypothetical protein